MTIDFDAPAPRLKIQEFKDCLILIDAKEIITDVSSEYSEPGERTDVTVCDITHVQDDGTGVSYEGIWIFQKALQSTLRSRVGTGKLTLTRLIQAPSRKGAFQWAFDNPSDADKQLARTYLEKHHTPTPAPAPGPRPVQPAPNVPGPRGVTQGAVDMTEFDRRPQGAGADQPPF